MLIKCVECDHTFGDDEAVYRYKGESYCADCYRAVRKLEGAKQEKGT
jgi:hypothetical protein